MESPLVRSGLDLERDKDQGRDIELCADSCSILMLAIIDGVLSATALEHKRAVVAMKEHLLARLVQLRLCWKCDC